MQKNHNHGKGDERSVGEEETEDGGEGVEVEVERVKRGGAEWRLNGGGQGRRTRRNKNKEWDKGFGKRWEIHVQSAATVTTKSRPEWKN